MTRKQFESQKNHRLGDTLQCISPGITKISSLPAIQTMSTSLLCFKDKPRHPLTQVHTGEAEFVRFTYRVVRGATGSRVPLKQAHWKVCTQHGCLSHGCGARVPSCNPSPPLSQRSWGHKQLGPALNANGLQDSLERVPGSHLPCSKTNINSQAQLWLPLVTGPAELGKAAVSVRE